MITLIKICSPILMTAIICLMCTCLNCFHLFSHSKLYVFKHNRKPKILSKLRILKLWFNLISACIKD
ncbi:hypothetical protein MIDIC_490033 [Alphaproteobacteria bacterium]